MKARLGILKFSIGKLRLSIDLFLPIVLGLVAYTLAYRYFPDQFFAPDKFTYLIVGLISSLGLIVSILFHEAGHSLAAKLLNIPVQRIHINLFGGMAELKYRPLFPIHEFYISIAGPIASGVLALVLALGQPIIFPLSYESYHIMVFLTDMNLLLALFNLIPIYPLDGGRVIRSFLWYKKKHFYRASDLMHRFSSFFISVIFILAIIFFFLNYRNYAFWTGLLGLYISWLVMLAKNELTRPPHLEDLIMPIDESENSPAMIIQNLVKVSNKLVKNAWIPVIVQSRCISMLDGEEIISFFKEESLLSDYMKPIKQGSFIEVYDEDSFSKEIVFLHDIIPVFKNSEFLGMGDAREVRFWLAEMRGNGMNEKNKCDSNNQEHE